MWQTANDKADDNPSRAMCEIRYRCGGDATFVAVGITMVDERLMMSRRVEIM